MKAIFNFKIMGLLSFLLSNVSLASVSCEGHCNAYWETTSSIYGTGSTRTNAINSVQASCEGQGGVIRNYADCIDHAGYTICTLICNHPVNRNTSTSAYGNDRSAASEAIRANCNSYYSSYKSYPLFNVSYNVGACR